MEILKIVNSYCKLEMSDGKDSIKKKENQLVDALEAYLKEECYESYVENNFRNILKKARESDSCRSEIIKIIQQFISE